MARPKTYHVQLTDEQVKQLKTMIHKKKISRTLLTHCQILLDLDEAHGKSYSRGQAARVNGVCVATVSNVIREYHEQGFEACLSLKRSINSDNARRKVDGRAEAQLIELACGPVPGGHARWTMRLLAEKSKVVLDIPVSKDTVSRTLKKTNFSLKRTAIGVSRQKKMPNL